MAPSSTSTPTSGGKAMSSRLLTMKFMQRAAASPSSPLTPEGPSTKRRKVVDDSPSKFNVDALADQRTIQAAIADEEAKRQAALERQAAAAGDTKWVLSFEDGRNSRAPAAPSLRIIQTGFANLDSSLPIHSKPMEEEDAAVDKPHVVGRKSFGKFNRGLEKQQNPSLEDSSSNSDTSSDENSESGAESDDSDDDGPGVRHLIKKSSRDEEAAARVKAERKAKKKAEKAELQELAKKRKKKELNLNGLSSLSGRQDKVDTRTCYRCGGPHLQKDCPKSKRAHDGGDDGPPRKARKSR